MTKDKKMDTKILIVEDETVISKAYAEEMRDQGFVVFTAGNGRDGLALALAERPNLILLDILMPIMDGLTMMDKLRAKNTYGKNVPIILLTNMSANEKKLTNALKKNESAYYLAKSDWALGDVVEKVIEKLNAAS